MNRFKFFYILLLGMVFCTVPAAAFADVADIDIDADTDSDSDSDADSDSASDGETDSDTGTDAEMDSDSGGDDPSGGNGGGSDSGCSFTSNGESSPVQFLAVIAMVIVGLRLRRKASK